MLSMLGSLWLTSPVLNRSGTGSCQGNLSPSNDATASW